jgi:tetratricopeptide (TPR) repeat protein
VIAHFNLGIAYLDKKLIEEAKREFRTVLELNPNFYQAKQFLDYIENNYRRGSLE